MSGQPVRTIDLHHLGREGVISALLVGDVIVDPGPSSCIEALIEGLAGLRPRALALTHIHLDHAGAAGTLVRRWPELEVWVHERGAPHLADPSKLLASATRLYGDEMDRLWGELAAVPERNLRVLRGGEEVDGFEVAYTPGHASHHVCYLHSASGTAFCGDLAGVRVKPGARVFAPTPPPDIDLVAWRESLQRVRAWSPRRLAIAHYGLHDDAAQQLDAVELGFEHTAALARELDVDGFSAQLRQEYAETGAAAACEQAMPPDQSWAGLQRYFSLNR
jgi:glyoxylase-like metal-dependent hydrolase (beta-lactamase superfamily II)